VAPGAAVGVQARGPARVGYAPDWVLRRILVIQIGARKCRLKKAAFWSAGTDQGTGRESRAYWRPGAWSGTSRKTAVSSESCRCSTGYLYYQRLECAESV
jgi:hypothetical protein